MSINDGFLLYWWWSLVIHVSVQLLWLVLEIFTGIIAHHNYYSGLFLSTLNSTESTSIAVSTPTHQFLNKSVGRSVSKSVSRMKCGDGYDADAVILMSSSRCRLKHYMNTEYNGAYQGWVIIYKGQPDATQSWIRLDALSALNVLRLAAIIRNTTKYNKGIC